MWSYFDFIVFCWGGVVVSFRSVSEFFIGGSERSVRVFFFRRRGRFVVCVIFIWGGEGKGVRVRSFVECFVSGNILLELFNFRVGGFEGSSEGKDYRELKLF